MDNSEERLQNIFQTVFPDLPPERIATASQENVETWDSVAAITLMNLIEEDFGMTLDLGDVADLTSFPKILEYINARLAETTA